MSSGKEGVVDLGLKGAKAVVTGGSKGMGLAIAQSLGAEGASVAIMARGEGALSSAAERIRNAGAPEVLSISVDLAEATSIASAYASVRDDIGRAGLPEEIASITTYLASRCNGYVTGAAVNVDGGSDFI